MKVSDFRVSDLINILKKADENAALCLFVNEEYVPLAGIESRYYQHYEDRENPCDIQINLKARKTALAVRPLKDDSIERFLADATIRDKDATISAPSLYSLYQNWAEDAEEAYILTDRRFWNKIRQSGYSPERKLYGWVWHGLKSIDD